MNGRRSWRGMAATGPRRSCCFSNRARLLLDFLRARAADLDAVAVDDDVAVEPARLELLQDLVAQLRVGHARFARVVDAADLDVHLLLRPARRLAHDAHAPPVAVVALDVDGLA